MGIDLPADDPWAEDPDHPVADWQTEVANDDTRQGYWNWAASRINGAKAQAPPPLAERCRPGLVGTTR